MLHCFLSVLRSIALLHLFCVLVLLYCIIFALVMLYCTYIVRWRWLLCTCYILRLAFISFIVSFILVHLSRFGHWRCDFYYNDTWKRTEREVRNMLWLINSENIAWLWRPPTPNSDLTNLPYGWKFKHSNQMAPSILSSENNKFLLIRILFSLHSNWKKNILAISLFIKI